MLLVAILASVLAVQPPAPQKVLFIGNSLTYANDLGGMVQALARAAGDPIVTRTIAFPNYSLEDHWGRGDARKAIPGGGWATVIVQQGPSSQLDSQFQLRQYVARFDKEISRAGARIGVYMVWPPRTGPGTFKQVSESYARAARDVKGLLLPVGDAIRLAMERNPKAALLDADGFHPSPLGTYLAAIVIHQQLTGRAEPFVPETVPSFITVSPEMVTLLAAAAADAVRAVRQ